MSERRKRALPFAAETALDIIRGVALRRMSQADFELRMSQRGCNGQDLRTAFSALTRRKWVHLEGRLLVISDAGWLAAEEGIGVPDRPKRTVTKPTRHRRLPGGLF